jgi:hypothetical protein
MLVSVSTVKDTLANVERFVARNLGSGIDHMVVFLDADQPDVLAHLSGHPQVTVVEAADDRWWAGARPDGLNRRQHVNANVVKALLTRAEWAEWVFHVDSDEVVHLDRVLLEQLPADTGIVHLAPLELVSRDDERAAPTLYKRLLDDDELVLLKALGVLDRAANEEYFHGHVGGKSGMRPSLDAYSGIHKPTDDQRQTLPGGLSAPWLAVLHLESPSRAAFVRKWRNLLSSGPRPKVRRARTDLVTAIDTLVNLDLPPDEVDALLGELYERHVRDDVPLLDRLGFLERVDPDAAPYPAREVPREDLDALRDALGRVAGQDKSAYRGGPPGQVEALLDEALGRRRSGWLGRRR